MADVATAQLSLSECQAVRKCSGLRRRYLEDEDKQSISIDSRLGTIPGPDIQWHPSFETYRQRVSALAELGLDRPKTLPDGFPKAVKDARAWTGSEFANGCGYVVTLSQSEVLEVERALSYFKTHHLNGDPDDVSRTSFPLPTLESKLESVAQDLHIGRGFAVLRGLEPKRYSARDNLLIYLGVTAYIAEHRAVQDSGGNMVIHVKDLGDIRPDSELRQSPYATNAQPFHNDVCDILAMYVQEQAAEGGESRLASCAQIYNDIAATRPDVIHTLSQPDWIFDKHRTPAYWNTRALLFNFEDHGPGFCFSRRPITGSFTSPRSPGVPPMSEVQAEALDMVQFTAVEHQLTMRLQRGDIQLINNLAVFHSRSHFRDSPEQKRHIMRLWLRNEVLAWKTPEGLQRTWFEKYGESDRRKIATWNLYPGASRERMLFRSDSCT